MLPKLLLMLRVENDLNKMSYLVSVLRYFDVSGFQEVVKSHLGEFYFLAVCFPQRETLLFGSN